MSKIINSVRWTFMVPLLLIGLIILSTGIIVSSMAIVVTDRENVKGWLDESEFYEKIVDFGVNSLLNEINKSSGDSALENSEFLPEEISNESKIAEEAEKIFTPEWIEEETEEVIDSVYDYLERESNEINFEINLSEPNENGQKVLSGLFKSKLSALPDCTDNKAISLDDFDLYKDGCVPKNLDRRSLNETIDKSVQEIMLFENMTISSENLDINTGDLEPARNVFMMLKYTPYILLSIIIVISGIIFFLAPGSRNKYVLLGTLFIASGLIASTAGVIAKANFNNTFSILENSINESPSGLIDLIKPVMEEAYNSIIYTDIILSIITVIAGIVLLSIGYKRNRIKPTQSLKRKISF